MNSSCRASAVAIAFPDVSWSPVVFTPGRFIFAEPSKDTPPIVTLASLVTVQHYHILLTVKSNFPLSSSYATLISVSVLLETIAPTIS